ncbi:MAG: ChbG/HpnK family deacetylase [Proteobacteria bacterium]|nr:ChbG/HpnK family deacetylase [Pseudomonadota bacterium]
MKKLIINADDCGADEARNAGIFEAINKGVVTSISILPNGPAFNDAIRRIKSLDNEEISLGVHINLSEGKPLSSGLQILAGPDGCFPGKLPAMKLFINNNNALEREITIELDAQVKKLLNAGMLIHHLDSHHHIHAFPAVIKAAISAAIKYKIPWIRIPEETKPSYSNLDISEEIAAEAGLFSKYATEARTRIETTGIRTTNHFRGLYLKGRFSLGIMEELLLTLPDGLTEFMTHPGHADTGRLSGPFSTFSTQDRERELETLVHPGFPLLLKKSDVTLTPFPDI